jgi:hypothetical protein
MDGRGEAGVDGSSVAGVSVPARVVELGDSVLRALLVMPATTIARIALAKIAPKSHL